jgi:hypothetical protein
MKYESEGVVFLKCIITWIVLLTLSSVALIAFVNYSGYLVK